MRELVIIGELQRIVDDVSRIHIPENMVGFAENLDKVMLETPEVGESVLDRQGQICVLTFVT